MTKTTQTVVDLPDYDKVVFPDTPPVDLRVAFPRVPAAASPLLGRLLALDPAQRPSAYEALGHEYFYLAPLPCDPSELPVVPRPLPGAAGRAGEGRRRRRKGARVSGWSSSSEEEEGEGDASTRMVED